MRILLITAVCVGIAALATAACVLSYSAIHAFAQEAGVPARLARAVPVMVDAMLVVALAATLALRGAGLPSRLLAWVILLAVLAAGAGADAMRADGRTLPHHVAALTVAVVPWALLLLAFVLLLAMLRYARLRRQVGGGRRVLAAASAIPDLGAIPAYASIPAQATFPGQAAFPAQVTRPMPVPLELPPRPVPEPLTHALPEAASPSESEAASPLEAAPRQTAWQPEQDAVSPVTDSLWDRLAGPRWEALETYQRSAVPDAGLPPGPGPQPHSDQADSDLAPDSDQPLDSDLAPDSDRAPGSDPPPDGPGDDEALDQVPAATSEADARGLDTPGLETPGLDAFSSAPISADGHEDPDMPVFHRLWSSPTPPTGQS